MHFHFSSIWEGERLSFPIDNVIDIFNKTVFLQDHNATQNKICKEMIWISVKCLSMRNIAFVTWILLTEIIMCG